MYDIFIEPKIIIYYHQLFVASLSAVILKF